MNFIIKEIGFFFLMKLSMGFGKCIYEVSGDTVTSMEICIMFLTF